MHTREFRQTMKHFKRFLAEEPQILYESSTKFSTHMETVIGECFDAAWVANGQKKGKKFDQAIEILIKKQGTKEFKTAKKHWEVKVGKAADKKKEAAKKLLAFGNVVKNAVKTPGKYKIQKKGQMTDDWMSWSDKTGSDTSKTDVVIGEKNCSVKNAGGAQLMSGKKGESKATVEAAAKAIKLDDEIKNNLTGLMDKLQEHTTDGYYASMDLLKRFKASNPGTDAKMFDWAKRTVDKWDKINIPYEKLKKANPKTKDDKIKTKLADYKSKLDNLEKPNDDIRKVAGNPEKAAEAPTRIRDKKFVSKDKEDEVQATFLNKVEGIFERNQANVKKELNKQFGEKELPTDFKLAFVYEAASGNHKFGSGAIQRANYMLSWLKKPAIEDFVVHVNPIKDRKSPTINKYAKQIDVQVNWKSSATNSHLGYNVYQNVRLGLGKLFTESQQIYENYSKQCNIYQEYLNENAISEGAFLDRIKDLANKFMAAAKKAWNKFVSFIKEAIDKIAEFAKDGVSALGNMFGFEMDVRDSLLNNDTLKLKI